VGSCGVPTAALHEEILNVDAETEARVKKIGIEAARASGLTEEEIAALYGR
jgi:hypothetical protein